jgi:hypothetical protein
MDRQQQKHWRVAAWPPLAWLETFVKLIALAAGIAAGFRALAGPALDLPADLRWAQLIVLGVLALGLVAAVWDRWQERELVAMGFVIVNNLGHWGMLLAFFSPTFSRTTLLLFAGLMLAGDLVKIVFLRVHAFTVRGQPMSVMIGLTAAYVLGYGLLIALELFA